MENKRGSWGSNFGFLMAAIGSAVGLGNIWGFPYKMGANGGFAFLIVYLVLVILVGITVMLGELALGRRTGQGAVGAYRTLCKKHTWVGYLGVVSGFVILAFYCVLGGMVTRYMIGFLIQIFGGDGFAGQGTGFFGYFVYNSGTVVVYFAIFMAVTMSIVMGGIEGGIEKFCKIAMPALFVILLFVIIYVACQPGAAEGYKFMFTGSGTGLEYLSEHFGTVVKKAAGQMFFSLSLGMGCMITYGSFLSKKDNLQRNAVIIPAADTLIAIMAGMCVMPACAAFGVDYTSGPGLLFVSLHAAFDNLTTTSGIIGSIIGFLFYLLVFIAAVTSSISLLEVCTTFAIDNRIKKGRAPGRRFIAFIFAAAIFVVGLPVALDALGNGGATLKAPFEILGIEAKGPGYAMWNDCWLDFYDLISEGILMPLGALLMSLFIGWKYKTKLVKDECELTQGTKFRLYGWFKAMFMVVVPILMLFVLVAQVCDFMGIAFLG